MKTFVIAIVFIVAFALSDSSNAQLADLITPLNATEQSLVRGNNDYFVKRNTYWSKQHRIVKVDYSLLTEAKRFRIEFFDGRSIVVETEEVKRLKDGQSVRWTGNIVEPNYTIGYLTRNGVTQNDAEFLRPRIRRVEIRASEVSFDPESRRKHQRFHDEFDKFRSPEGLNNDAFDVNATFNYPADLSKLTDESNTGIFAARYILMPFDMEQGYHLLFEEDPSKKYPGVKRSEETPEIRDKRLAFESFLQGLGPNPAELNTVESNRRPR